MEMSIGSGINVEMLRKLGIYRNSQGMHYLREALILAAADSEFSERITKMLYPKLAFRHKTTPVSVESSIRSAIDCSWNKADRDFRKTVFGELGEEGRRRPSNSIYIQKAAAFLQSRQCFCER